MAILLNQMLLPGLSKSFWFSASSVTIAKTFLLWNSQKDFNVDTRVFLSNREQQAVLNSVTSGVPQGSVLGPVLFTMFVNDIPSIVSSPVYLFADDTKLFHVIKNRDDQLALQNDLNLLYNWSITWQLSFNKLKCKHLHLGPPHHFEPYLSNSLEIDSHKDLGSYTVWQSTQVS